MKLLIGYSLDMLCRLSGHRLCHTWVGRTAYTMINGGK